MFAYTGKDEGRFPDLFSQMYRQRYEIYVKRRKWSGLKPIGDEERDEFDTSSAIYLVALDADDEILAGLRLLPTIRPHILGELFPHLALDGVPSGPDILELTRFYVAPFKSSRGGARLAGGGAVRRHDRILPCQQCATGHQRHRYLPAQTDAVDGMAGTPARAGQTLSGG